jgi:hypothetical protein
MNDEELKVTINPVEEHDEKYNVDGDVLKAANEKLKNIGKPLPEGTIKKGEIIIHKRTDQDYKNIWKAFLINEEKDFYEKMNYGKKKIKQIGVKKFIDFMDWRNVDDVGKWRTDKLHAVVCVHCNKEFAIFEYDDGLCENCKKLYDSEKLSDAINQAEENKPGLGYATKLSFMYKPDFRNKFLKDNFTLKAEEAAKCSFKGNGSYELLKQCVYSKSCFVELLNVIEVSKNQKEIFDSLGVFLAMLVNDKPNEALELLRNIYAPN